jgi:hypothetical protein
MTNFNYHRHLSKITQADIEYVKRKDAQYQSSWKRRGGTGAFFTVVRPWDRFESIARTNAAYDIFKIILQEGLDGPDGSLIACVRDLRRYLLLLEAEMMEQNGASSRHLEVISGMGRMSESPTTRLDDGLKFQDIDTDLQDHCHYMVTSSPQGLMIVDRRKTPKQYWEHLPRLRTELNQKEWEETPEEYRGLFEWLSNDNKWRLREQYREHWGKE